MKTALTILTFALTALGCGENPQQRAARITTECREVVKAAWTAEYPTDLWDDDLLTNARSRGYYARQSFSKCILTRGGQP